MSEREIPDDVSQHLREYLEINKGVSISTFKGHKSVGRSFEKWLREQREADSILDAEPRDVLAWIHKLDEDGYSGSTIQQYFYCLRSIFDEFVVDDEETVLLTNTAIEQNPAGFEFSSKVDLSTGAKKQEYADNNEGVIYLSPSEIRKLREHVPKPKVRNELIIKILVQTGLRRGELSNLRLDLLDREQGTVTVTAEMSKTGKKREVAYKNLDPELSLWLDGGYRDRHPDAEDSPYLLLNRQSPKLSPSRISSIVREAADNAGMDDEYMENVRGVGRRRITAHSLRSTFIMRLLDAGIPTATVMELSGHESLETVENYANVLNNDAIEAYQEADIDFGTG